MISMGASYMIIPGFFIVDDDGCTKAPGRVDAGTSNRDCGQVDHEHSKPNWKWSQNLFPNTCYQN